MLNDPIVIVGAARTPMGGFQGDFASLSASDLGAVAIKAAVERAGIAPDDVQEVIMGNVLPAGQGQAPARQASLKAGLPLAAGCTTVNKMCGSAMKATMLAHDADRRRHRRHHGRRRHGEHDQRAVPAAEGARRLPDGPPDRCYDHMFLDGLEDAYDKGRLMGTFAEDCAAKYAFTREAQDEFALASLVARARRQQRRHVRVGDRAGHGRRAARATSSIDKDEQPAKASPDKIPPLKPAFRKDGTVTAANSSSISDGAAALVLMRRSTAEKRGLDAARGDRRARDARAGARAVHDGAGRRDREALSRRPAGRRRTSTSSRSTRRSPS